MVILGGGGHTAQMLKLVDLLGPRHSYEYIVGLEDKFSAKKIKKKGRVYKISKPRKVKDTLHASVWKTTRGFAQAMKVLRRSRPDMILSAGPGIAVPVFYAAKLLCIKTAFIESWSRVHKKSTSGRLIYGIADLFFVQWPEMKRLYPKATYAGRLV